MLSADSAAEHRQGVKCEARNPCIDVYDKQKFRRADRKDFHSVTTFGVFFTGCFIAGGTLRSTTCLNVCRAFSTDATDRLIAKFRIHYS